MKIFLISPVRNVTTDEQSQEIREYVERKESGGHKVHWPKRDTKQDAKSIDICKQNALAIADSDEVHIWFDPSSKGSHFDLGIAFALSKKLVVVRNVDYGPGKSFPRMVDEWQEEEG